MITGLRSIFVGAHVTPAVKKALQDEAERRHTTMSQLVYEILKKTLRVEEKAA